MSTEDSSVKTSEHSQQTLADLGVVSDDPESETTTAEETRSTAERVGADPDAPANPGDAYENANLVEPVDDYPMADRNVSPEFPRDTEPVDGFDFPARTAQLVTTIEDVLAPYHSARIEHAYQIGTDETRATPAFTGELDTDVFDLLRRHIQYSLTDTDVRVVVTNECWYMCATGPSNVAMYEMYLPRERWDSYNCDEPGVLAFDWESFAQSVKSLEKDNITVQVKQASRSFTGSDSPQEETREVMLYEQDGKTVAGVRTVPPSMVREPVSAPSHTYETTLKHLSAEEMIDTLTNYGKDNDIISMVPTESGLVCYGLDEIHSQDRTENELSLIDGEHAEFYETDATGWSEKTWFDAGRLRDAFRKLLKSQQKRWVELNFSKDLPLSLTMELYNGAFVRYRQAPKITERPGVSTDE